MSSWTCAACTFINASSEESCAICGTAKQKNSIPSWACAICTFQNVGGALLCEMCGASPPGSEAQVPNLQKQKSAGQIEQENMLKLNSLFSEYEGQDDDKDIMTDEKMHQFFENIGVSLEHRNVLAIAWKLNAAEFGEFTRQEFVNGFTRLNCKDIKTISDWVKVLDKDLKKKSEFKKFYTWAFKYCKENDAKTMAKEQAIGIWQLLLTGTYEAIDTWITFLESNKCDLRSVNNDLWMNLLDFVFDVKPNFSGFEEGEPWHSCIDEYVEYLRENRSSET